VATHADREPDFSVLRYPELGSAPSGVASHNWLSDCRLAKICRQNINWISRDPRREIDRFVNPAIKSDQNAARLAADVFDRVTVALWYVAGVSAVKQFRPETAVRRKHCHAYVAVDNVLPFVSVRMPVQLAERTPPRDRE